MRTGVTKWEDRPRAGATRVFGDEVFRIVGGDDVESRRQFPLSIPERAKSSAGLRQNPLRASVDFAKKLRSNASETDQHIAAIESGDQNRVVTLAQNCRSFPQVRRE